MYITHVFIGSFSVNIRVTLGNFVFLFCLDIKYSIVYCECSCAGRSSRRFDDFYKTDADREPRQTETTLKHFSRKTKNINISMKFIFFPLRRVVGEKRWENRANSIRPVTSRSSGRGLGSYETIMVPPCFQVTFPSGCEKLQNCFPHVHTRASKRCTHAHTRSVVRTRV